MNSFAHYSFGAVGQWLMEAVGGIQPSVAGFKEVQIRPQPGGCLTWAKASYQSKSGRISSDWALRDGRCVGVAAVHTTRLCGSGKV